MKNIVCMLFLTSLLMSCNFVDNNSTKTEARNTLDLNEASVRSGQTQLNSFNKNSNEFLDALRFENKEKLKKYGVVDGKLSYEDEIFLRTKLKPLISNNDLEFREWGRNGNLFSVIFYIKDDSKFLDTVDLNYLRSKYIKRYFICEFSEVENNWKIRNGFCLSEQDDPYAEYDDSL